MKALPLFLLLLVGSKCYCAPQCEDGSAFPLERKNEAIALGISWAEHATYCNFGKFQVLVPQDPSVDSFAILKDGKLLVMHEPYLVAIFQDYGLKNPVPFVSVQDWNKDGMYERLDYSLVDGKGKVVGNVQDKVMDGSPKVVLYKK